MRVLSLTDVLVEDRRRAFAADARASALVVRARRVRAAAGTAARMLARVRGPVRAYASDCLRPAARPSI